MKHKILIAIAIMVSLLVVSSILVESASADTILFPWVIKSNKVSTYISVINTAGNEWNGPGYEVDGGIPNMLQYQYWYKASTSNTLTEACSNHSFMSSTSKNDIVTFDAAGIDNGGKALYNDQGPYNTNGFRMVYESPRMAFLLVTNNTPTYTTEESRANIEGTLSGEALIVDTSTGTAWGYSAYNARNAGVADMQTAQVYFSDGLDRKGEVIAAGEYTPVTIMPPSLVRTDFYVTPIGTTGQRNGHINAKIKLCSSINESGYCYIGMYDNDENIIDWEKSADVVCIGVVKIQDLMIQAAYEEFIATGGQGWSYIATENGTTTINPSSQAVIGKLETRMTNQSIDLVKFRPPIMSKTATANFTWITNSESIPIEE